MRIFIESVLVASESLFGNAYNPEQNEILAMDDDTTGAAVTTGAIAISGAGPVVDVPP